MNLDDLIGLLILLIYMGAFFRRAKKPDEDQPKKEENKPRPLKLPRIFSWLDSRLRKMEERLQAGTKEQAAEQAPSSTANARQERDHIPQNGAEKKSEPHEKKGPTSFLELLLYEEPETPAPEEEPLPKEILEEAPPLKGRTVTVKEEIPTVSEEPFPLKKEPAAKEEIPPPGIKAVTREIKRKPKAHYPSEELRKAIIWAEILGPPRAVRLGSRASRTKKL